MLCKRLFSELFSSLRVLYPVKRSPLARLMVIERCSKSRCADADATQQAHDDNFVIGNDDVLAISVWKEPELTKSVPVRSDGKISLPLGGRDAGYRAKLRFSWSRTLPRS